jgi:quercetin dioxygenase-like cupin family protein
MSIGRKYRGSILPSGAESPSGMSVPRHTHTREDETYYVLSGELEVVVGEEVFILRVGDTLIAPPDIPHKLRNSGNACSRPPGSRSF